VKKTILVTAVAAIISGPAAALETDFYGNIRLSLRGDNAARIDSSKLILGWKGSEDLGNGLTASFKIELEHDDANFKTGGSAGAASETVTTTGLLTAELQTNSGWANDRSWVAIGGDFGKVTLGREDTFDGWANGGTDIFAINGGHAIASGNELDNGIQYRGSAGAFQFGFGAELFTIGADGLTNAVNTTYGVSFSGDNFQVGAHGSDADSNAPTGLGIGSQITPGDNSIDIGGYYILGNFTLGVTVGDNGAATNSDVTDVVLAFPLGPCGALVGLATGDFLDARAGVGPDGDIMNLGYNCSSGAAYYGLEYNDDDAASDSLFIAYYGIRW